MTLYSAGDSKIEAVDRINKEKAIIADLQIHLQGARNRMKRNADLHRKQFEFHEKD